MSIPNTAPTVGANLTPRLVISHTGDRFITEASLHELVGQALKDTRRPRKEIAAQLAALTGRRITKRMVDDWSAPGKSHVNFPAGLVKPLAIVTGNYSVVLAVLPLETDEALQIGEWFLESKWALERLGVKLPKSLKGATRRQK